MPQYTSAQIGELLAEQRALFERGETLPYAFRAAQLTKLKGAILRHEKDITAALAADLGKHPQESYTTEIGFVLSDIAYTLRKLKKWMKPVSVHSPITVFASKSRILRQPYGSVLILGPYNYPFQLLLLPLVAAIAAGNCAVLSPSEMTPNVSRVIRELIGETYDRSYVFCAEGGVENNTTLLNSRFDKIFFTGSVNVGKIVMRAASENLVPVALELGGKSPVIVDETAKLDAACERIVWGKFLNAGQTCVAPDYVFVHKRVFDGFVDKIQEKIREFYGSEPQKSEDFGRIVNAKHMDRLCKILERDREAVVFGGDYDLSARYIAPTLLCPEDVRTAACMEEEIFGPILPIFAYGDLQEVTAYINRGEKPLALYIFSEDKKKVRAILRATDSGGVAVNDTISHILNPALPFGGVGSSGMGRYHGEAGFSEFSYSRSVLVRSTRIRIRLAYPPFSEKKLQKLRKLIK